MRPPVLSLVSGRARYVTSVMSFLLGRLGRLPCQSASWMVNASIVTERCLVWICVKLLPPELYLPRGERRGVSAETAGSVRDT